MPRPLLPKARKKPANFVVIALAATCLSVAVSAGPPSARALPVPSPRPSGAHPTEAPANPNATVLPLDSSLFFVLDGTISSRAKPGSVVNAHLRDPIVLGDHTIAPAGSLVQIQITQASPAHAGNEDGFVDIYFKSLRLANGTTLPLITPTAHLDPHISVGKANTQAVADTVGDIFIPGHYLYHMLRKGRDVEVRPGSVIRARTAATLSLHAGAVVITTPPPLVTDSVAPHSDFSPAPIYTPPGFIMPTPKPSISPSVKPTSTP